MDHVERCHRAHEQQYYGEYLKAIGYFATRLKDTKAGVSLLQSWLATPPYFVSAYVLPEAPLVDSADTARKSVLQNSGVAESVFALWQAFPYGFRVHEALDKQAKRLVDGFNNAFGADVVARPAILVLEFDTGRFRIQPNDNASWAPWANNVTNISARVGTVCTALGGAFALREILDGRKSPFGRTSAGFSLVEAGLSSVVAYQKLTTSLASKGGAATAEAAGTAALKHLGAVAALTAVVSDSFGAIDAGSVGDSSKAFGHGLGAAGAALVFWGAATAVTGAPGAVLLLAGALLSAAGFVLTAFTEDDAIEIFARHCFWGNNYGQSSGKPYWAGTELSAWPSKPAVQLRALLNILFGFEVDRASNMAREGKGGAQVTYGAALDTSVFHVEWTIEYESGPPLVTHHAIRPATREAVKISGPDLKPAKIVWHTAEGTRPRFEMERPYAEQGSGRVRKGHCQVWLDVDGTSGHRLPQTFVPWSFVMPGPDRRQHFDEAVHSVDY